MIEIVVTSSVLILAILVLRRASRGRISMKLRYTLWLVVALRLLLPISVGNSSVSVMNLLPSDWWGFAYDWNRPGDISGGGMQMTGGENNTTLGKSDGTGQGLMKENGQSGQSAQAGENLAANRGNVMNRQDLDNGSMADTGKDATRLYAETAESDMGSGAPGRNTGTDEGTGRIRGLLFAVWLFGALSVSGYLLISQVRFERILLRKRHAVRKEEIPQIFVKRLAARQMKVYAVNGLASPCLVGRNIYIDTKLVRQEQKFMHVLAHEYCHARQHDVLWAFLRSALVAVYWFHPLVWAAAFAAKQDSELACDEAVIHLLGEKERFAYGRTLLYLLNGGGQIDCAGTALTMEGGKHGVKERVSMLAKSSGRKRWTAAVIVMTMLFVCGCAFTGGNQQKDDAENQAKEQIPQEGTEETILEQPDNRQAVNEASNAEFERIMKEYEEAVGAGGQALEAVQQDAAFYQALNYQGIMAGKDDSELFLDRKVDYQGYYEFSVGERDNPLEDGWYLVCRNEEARISLYGLYTQEFGFRGIKTLIGEDVNTYDMPWCPSARNESAGNIRVLEEAEDGLPRRFVFQILSVNTSDREIWNLYSALRYDTGTVQAEELTAETYNEWVSEHLSFVVDEENNTLQITYDGDMELETLDISDYQDLRVEGVQLSPDVAGFELDSEAYEGEVREGDGGYEGIVMHLAIGLKLEGLEGVWTNELPPLAVQVLCRQGQKPAFVLQKPKMDTRFTLRNLSQSRKLEEIREHN